MLFCVMMFNHGNTLSIRSCCLMLLSSLVEHFAHIKHGSSGSYLLDMLTSLPFREPGSC